MAGKTPKIPTEEELRLRSRALRPDDEKYMEFYSQNLEAVLQYLESEKIKEKFRKYLEEKSSRLVQPNEDILALEEGEPAIRLVTRDGDFPPEDVREAFIEKWIHSFAYDLCYLLFIVTSSHNDRLNFSRSGLVYRRGKYSTHLQIIEGILDNPDLMHKLGLKRETLLADQQELQKLLEKYNPTVKRAGQRKFLEFPLSPLIPKLTLLGYTTKYSRGKFLFNLLRKFNIPLSYDKTKEEVISEIGKWESVKYLD